MILNSPYISGSLTVTGNITAQGGINVSGSIASASYAVSASEASTLQGLGSASFAPASTFNTVSQSYAASSASLSTRVTTNETNISTLTSASASFAVVSSSYAAASGSLSTRVTNVETTASVLTSASSSFATMSGSLSTRVTNLEVTSSTVSQSFASTSGSISGRVTLIEGQYATTGSNNFTGPQFVNQASNAISFTSTASLYTDGGLRVSKDSFVSGTAYFNNVVVYGTSSIQYITSSQVNFGTNIITVNTDTPAVRFGGLAVFDSGSTQLTGSMLWDSEKNHWIYSNPSGSSYNSAMLMNGPRNTGSLGTEQGTTACALMMGQGGDHITSSMIYSYGNATCFYGQSYISGSGDTCFAGTVCAPSFVGGTMSGTTIFGSTIACSPIGCFATSCATSFIGGTMSGTTIYGSTAVCSPVGLFSGCVGIGTASPLNLLHVSQPSANTVFRLGNNSAYDQFIYFNGNSDWSIGMDYSNSNAFVISNNSSLGTNDRVVLTTSGNLGLGVTPSNAYADSRTFEIGAGGILWSEQASSVYNSMSIGSNFYYNVAGDLKYKNSGVAASRFTQYQGSHIWYTAGVAPSAGAAITFTQAMTLNASGNLSIGNTNDTYKLDVSKDHNASTIASISNATSGTAAYAAYRIGSSANVWLYNFSNAYTTSGRFAAGTFLIDVGTTNGININTTSGPLLLSTNNTAQLTIASTGSATFSSTVTLVNDLTINAALTPLVFLNTTSTNKASGFITQESGTSKWAIGSNFGSGDGTFNLYNYGAAARYLTIASTGAACFACCITAPALKINSPTYIPLVINSSYGQVGLEFQLGGTGFGGIGSATNFTGAYTNSSTDLGLGTNGSATSNIIFATGTGSTRRIVITAAGNVGIGATAPSSLLHLCGAGTGAMLRIQNTSTVSGDQGPLIQFMSANQVGNQDFETGYIQSIWQAEGNAFGIRFATKGVDTSQSEKMRITHAGITCFAGTVCAPCFATISDYRMKSNIRPIEGLSIIMNTKPYKFEYNYDCSTSFGMIAHELQDTLPEAVFGQKDGEVMQGVDYMKLLPITIKAIQEQQHTICSQAGRIRVLESCLGMI